MIPVNAGKEKKADISQNLSSARSSPEVSDWSLENAGNATDCIGPI
jgi:hypothetical protein